MQNWTGKTILGSLQKRKHQKSISQMSQQLIVGFCLRCLLCGMLGALGRGGGRGRGGGGLSSQAGRFQSIGAGNPAAATYSPVFVVGSCASHDLYNAQKRDVGSQYRLRVRNHSHCHFRGGDTGKAPTPGAFVNAPPQLKPTRGFKDLPPWELRTKHRLFQRSPIDRGHYKVTPHTRQGHRLKMTPKDLIVP